MLILTRKLKETINIGKDIKVHVLGIHGNQVRLGIDAPQHVIVDRDEITKRKAAEIPKNGFFKMFKSRK